MRMNKRTFTLSVISVFTILTFILSACDGDAKETGQTPGKKQVVMATMSENRFLEFAKEKYEALHPDIEIVYKVYQELDFRDQGNTGVVSMPTKEDQEKYISTINTELMSGAGPDILDTSDLPVNRYKDKKMLVNFYDMMDQDQSFKKADYFQNIWSSTELDSGLYSFPIDFHLEMLNANSELLEQGGVQLQEPLSWDDVLAATEKVREAVSNDVSAISGSFAPEHLASELVSQYYSQLVDANNKKAHFDSEDSRRLILKVKEMFDKGLTWTGISDSGDMGDIQKRIELTIFTRHFFMSPADFATSDTLYRQPSLDGNNDELSFGSSLNLGLNASSANKQEAWDFLKFLVSEEMQQSPARMGLPINKLVYNEMFDGMVDEVKKSGSVTTPHGERQVTMTAEQLESLRSLGEKANQKSSGDPKILDIFRTEIQPYFVGQKSLESALSSIQSKVTTYLNE
ncbi:ABC transporter substrate-binding protein [Paenibacillus sp. NPDC057967]|uniref:ABC transporter substrate-binding protein n=1 Tax=Paenibacillus sp. NPDC057967 TaxID=3346293 RepID=UPI0036D7978A